MKLWNELLNGEAYKSWMDNRLAGARIQPGTRLDPFGTSMRNAKKIPGWLKSVEEGKELEARGGNGAQNVTDLRSIGLLSPDKVELSLYGKAVLDKWRELGIDDDADENEFKRSVVMAGEGVIHEVALFQAALEFWKEIRDVLDIKEAVKNTE